MGKKTQKQREDAFLRLLSNFAVEQQQHNLPERVDLMAFFDLLDEHNVQVRPNVFKKRTQTFFIGNGKRERGTRIVLKVTVMLPTLPYVF